MDNSIKISIIIPAYNVEQWLPRCIDSVLAQDYTNTEVLLIDDGSTDSTDKVIDSYAAKDPRIVAIHQSNAGIVAVRDKGISLATGQYVGFVDGDDVIETDMYRRLLENALKYDADISHCGMKYCFYDGRVKLHYGTGEVIQFDRDTGVCELLYGRKIEPSLCNKLYRRDILIDSCLDVTVQNNEDLLRNFTLFSRANCSVFEDFCGYQYWRRENSMSCGGFKAKVCQDVLRARKLILEHADESSYRAAMQSYLNALISSYNSAVFGKTDEALKMRAGCKRELKRLKAEVGQLPKDLKFRAIAILKVAPVYHILMKLHEGQIQRRIKVDRAKVQKERMP